MWRRGRSSGGTEGKMAVEVTDALRREFQFYRDNQDEMVEIAD